MRQFCLSKKHVGSITTYQNHVSTLCGWLEKMLPLRTFFFDSMKMCRYFSFIFLEEHVVISPAFASPTFLINYQPNSASHDINVWWERVTTLVFLSLHFASVPQKRLGPRAPPTKHFRAAMADFRREISGSAAPNSGDMNCTCKKWFFIRVFNCFLTLFRFFVVWFARLLILPCFPEWPEKEQSGIPVCRQNLWHKNCRGRLVCFCCRIACKGGRWR